MESDGLCWRAFTASDNRKPSGSIPTIWRDFRCHIAVSPGSLPPLISDTDSCRKNDAPNSTEPHRGFGYVEFEDPEDIKDAIDNMDQSELFGKVIKVSAAKAPKNVNEGLGSKTALWEQVRSFCI